ncbi:MAG: J domain-containing protein, partial [Nitrososphaeraceae archaeon]|nr:J domain-containing protein [Nitrososphaeraceae archaeon]
DTTFLIIDVVFLVSNVASILILSTAEKSATKWIEDIYHLEWKGQPSLVKTDMNIIFDEVETNENASQLYGIICEKYLSILDSFAAMFGSLISAMIPDDAGATRIVIEMIISEGMVFMGKVPFMALSWIFGTMPTVMQEVLKNQKNLSDFFLSMLAYLKSLLPNEKDTFYQRVKKQGVRDLIITIVTPIVPVIGPILMPVAMTASALSNFKLVSDQIIKLIDGMIAPHTDSYAALIMRILPLVFATTLIFSRCTGAEEPEEEQQLEQSQEQQPERPQEQVISMAIKKCQSACTGVNDCIQYNIDLYTILNATINEPVAELIKKFRKLILIYHPDKFGFAECSRILTTAKEILIDNNNQKIQYDGMYATISSNPNKWPQSHEDFVNFCESCKNQTQSGGRKEKFQMKIQSGMPILNEERCVLQYGGMSESIRKKINLYNVLGIDKNANMNTIQKSYQKNSAFNKQDHSALVMKTAYDVLTNPQEKELYDSAFVLDNPIRWWPNNHNEFQEWRNKHPISKRIEFSDE